MLQAAHSAKAAALAQQKRLDVISNNLANVNTHGFKASSVGFQDMLYTQMVKPIGNDGANLERGTGVKPASTEYSLAQGAAIPTDNLLDFLIDDASSFFTVQNAYGQTLYTRNGSFAISNEADGRYIVTSQGYYVLDTNGQRIRTPDGSLDTMSVSANGALAMGTDEPFATLGLTTFSNPHGLSSAGSNCFTETVASGEPMTSPNATIQQGFLEGSNVDVAQEFTNAVITQKAFAFASRIITMADEMDALTNNMR